VKAFLSAALAIMLLGPPLAAEELTPAASPKTDGGSKDRLDRRVTGIEALEALVAGRTHYRTRADGSYEIEYHSRDGVSAYVWEGCVVYGEWWATPDEICFFYPESELQGPHCFFIERGKEGLEFWWSGNPVATEPTAVTVKDVEGNVERLPLGVSGECLVS